MSISTNISNDILHQTTPLIPPAVTSLESNNNSPEDKTESIKEQSSSSSFSDFLINAIGKSSSDTLSEEELYSSVIGQRLNEHSSESSDYYFQEKQKLISQMRRHDGYVPYEEIALKALSNTVSAGMISEEEAEKINSLAFKASQLDSNLNALYDDRGSADDPTIAIASLAEALEKAERVINEISENQVSITPRSLDLEATGGNSSTGNINSIQNSQSTTLSGLQKLDGAGGFLWKPVSESDGKLVILLPSGMAGIAERVEIHNSFPANDQSKIEDGHYTTDSNGGRPTFRFDKPGASYGEDLYVIAYNKDGSTAAWEIGKGSERND